MRIGICTYITFGIVSAVMAVGQQVFPLALNVTQFFNDSTRTRVEFSYCIADTHLVFIREGEHSVRAAVEVTFIIHGQDKSDTLSVFLESVQHISQRQPSILVGKRTMLLAPGQYTVTIRVRDAFRSQSAVLERMLPVNVRRFPKADLCASSLELAQWIAASDTDDVRQVNSSFVKGNFYVVPNPASQYEGSAVLLYAYIEFYNLDRCLCDSIDVHYRIMDAAMNEVFDLRYRRAVVGKAQAEVITVPLEGVPTGVYTITCSIERRLQPEILLARQQFYLLNPEFPPEQPTVVAEDELFMQSPFSTLEESQLDVEYRSARLVAGAHELDGYEQLTTLQARRRYLFRFWLQRDPYPSTPINERYEEFCKARNYAAKFYSTPRYPEGWNTDRGRVLLKYGFPSQIDRYYFNMDAAHPHEIWRFDNVQGGVIFVFVDQQGTENFVLVHSTALNEIRNENWYRQFAMPNYLDPNPPIR